MEQRGEVRISKWQGLNTRDSDLELRSGQSPSLSNVEFFREGFVTRNGVTAKNGTATGSEAINGLFDGWNHVLVVEGTNIKRINTSTGALTSINTGLTDGAIPCFASYNALDLMVNGVDNPKKWDGAAFGDLGGSPPVSKCIEVWRNHVWLGGLASPNQAEIRYSSIEDPESGWTQFLRVSKREKGSSVIALKAVPVPASEDGQRLAVFCDDGIFHFEGFTKPLFQIIPVNNRIGCISKRGVAVAEGITYWIDENGIYASPDGGRTVYLISWPIQPTFDGLNKARLQYALVQNFRYKRQLWWSVSDGVSSSHNLVLVYNYGLSNPLSDPMSGEHNWSLYEIKNGDTGLSAMAEVLVDGQYHVYGGDAAGDGWVYTLDDGTSDNGTAINWSLKTPRFLLRQSWSLYSILRKLTLVHNALAGSSIALKLYVDNARTPTATATLSVSGDGALFGSGIFGVGMWGGSAVRATDAWYNRMVRAVQFELSGTDKDKLFRCYELILEAIPKGGGR